LKLEKRCLRPDFEKSRSRPPIGRRGEEKRRGEERRDETTKGEDEERRTGRRAKISINNRKATTKISNANPKITSDETAKNKMTGG
jgi:hypothetical protein